MAVTTTWQIDVIFRVVIDGEAVVEQPWYLEQAQLQGVYLPSSIAGRGIITDATTADVVIVAAEDPTTETARTTVDLTRNCEQ